MKEKTRHLQSLLLSLMMLVMGAAGAWATGYTPSADEVIILNDVYSSTATTAGYSSHPAIAWGGTASASEKQAGDPNNGGVATSSNVNCYSVKGNGKGKNITVSVTGVSKIIIYHEKNDSRYIQLKNGSNTGSVIGEGSVNTYYTEVNLDSSTDYSILLYNSSSGNSDFYVYAIKLVPAYTVTYNANLTGTTGSVPTDATRYAKDATVTVKGNTGSLAKDGYTFLGWSTASGYQSTYYTADQTFAMGTANVTLYAQWKIDGSITSSPAASSTVKAGDAVTTSVTDSPATGMYFNQGSSAYTVDQLKGSTLRPLSAGWTVSGGATLGTDSWKLSVLLTDGTFYSDVLTNTFSVGVATPAISCSSNRVTITCATTGAAIYYTTDGNEPSSESNLYSAPFTIESDCTVRAIAIKSDTNSAEASLACTHEDISTSTALPVTFDFTNETYWPSSTDFSGAANANLTILDTSNSHNIVFHGVHSISDSKLVMANNGASNYFIAIPISGINGRIDIDVWAPFAASSTFTVRAALDTEHGTTVQNSSSLSNSNKQDVNKYVEAEGGYFNFRMTDITASEGVLYIGANGSSYRQFQKIRISTPTAYLVADKSSVNMGDGADPETVTIKNYSQHNAIIKTQPDAAVATATFNPSTNELVITPVAAGTTSVTLVVDEDGDGVADAGETSTCKVDITVTGITISTQPVSKVYKEGGDITALSVEATNTGEGSLTYQWYKNTVNSTTGGEKVGSNDASYSPSLTAEANAFYYCEVSATGAKTKTTDVVYVLYSNSKRYFQMSNVAGNKETSTNDEKITGQVIAGGKAYVQTSGDYRYITRPSTSNPHMYVAKNTGKYFKIELDNEIATDDQISVRLLGYNGASSGIIITDGGTNEITITQTGNTEKTYTATFPSTFNEKTTLYVKGIDGGLSNYFTDLIISKPADLSVTGPTPASQTVQSGETPAAFTVTATGGTGSYTYAWKQDTSASGSFSTAAEGTVVSDGGTSTFTPTSKSVADNTTYYYKCIVTSGGSNKTTGAATLTVTTLTHGYLTPSEFTENKYPYIIYKDAYDDQNSGDVSTTNHFWSLQNTNTWHDGKSISGIDNTSRKYLRLKYSTDAITFYVKNAQAFSFITEFKKNDNGTYCTFTVTVDDVEMGDFETTGNESVSIPLNASGSKIVISGPKVSGGMDVYFGRLTFYEKAPATINIMKNGETVTEATQYMGDGATEYEVETNGDGNLSLVKPTGATNVTNGYRTTYAEVTLNNGILRVTPRAATPTKPSTPETITIEHTDGTSYADASTTLNVTVKKHTLALAFSYDKASFKASTLTSGSWIPSGSLPTLTATRDGVEVTGSEFDALGIRYMSDDITIGSFASNTSYAITYGGGQGGARIYAYVDNRTNPSVSSAKAYFDLVVEDGTSNALPSTAKSGSGDDKQIYEQKQFRLANSQGVEVVKLTYGGYKYAKEGKWSNADKKGDYFIDGYAYYTRHDLDAFDEYGYQIKGMKDEATDAASSAKKQYSLSTWSSQNVGAHKFWYASGEGGTTGTYQRIRPFTLPTRGGYLKFEPKQTGKLTVYVYQNGTYSGGVLGSKPRLGYWFDQDGWVQHPTTAPITKQPLSDNMGSNIIELESNMDTKWTAANDDAAIKKLLINKWCSDANPNEDTPEGNFSNAATKPGGWFENPYYWLTESEVDNNLDEDETVISKKMVPVPYHNGYMVPEASYLKYKLNVVAGKTYYFYGMMTKVGYVGMNFVEDESVISSFAHNASLHLNATDNMATVVSGQNKNYTVYDEVTLPSNYKKGQWSTICLPFALSESQVEEAFGKGTQLTIYNGARKKGTGVYSVRYLSHVDRNILAGQPYFIKPTGVDANGVDLENVDGVIGSAVEGAPDTKTRITFNTVCIDKTHFSTSTSYGSNKDVNASGTDIDQYGYEFVGSTNNDQLLKYSYIVSGGKLRQFTGSTTRIPTYYAYLKPHTSEATSGSFSLQVDFNEENVETTWADDTDDDPTGVISMEAIADAMNNGKVLSGKAYNMMGQEVDPTSAKGIVIIDGKKYMFK